jgi:hypothetical protein
MKKLVSLLTVSLSLSANLLLSAGGFDVKKLGDTYSFKNGESGGKSVNITEVLNKKSKNINAVTIWITRNWQEDWFDANTTQKEILDKGYTPMFIFYYFADEINPKFIENKKAAYFLELKKFTNYLKKLNGQKIVVLNPEYNMFGVEKLDKMNDIFLKSYKILREDKQVIVGPCVGDFGNYKNINDSKEWVLFDKSLKRSMKKADFIAFQEMRGLTRNSKGDILRTPQRAYSLAKYLHKKYHKPTIFAYAAISSYGKDGESIQKDVYKGFVKYIPKMAKDADLIAFGTFHYFDYPGHVGYFKEAEECFGLLRKDGSAKPAFKYYNSLK